MKRTIFTALLSLTAIAAGAQTMYDGLNYSQNNYYGTARSIGMGNAMTAVGGDLGSIGINPAGSAVAGYSQFTITPNLTISSMNASYSAYPVGGADRFTNEQNKRLTRFSMPNIGLTFNWKTGNGSGLKAITYGLVVNGTNNFTGKMLAGGRNDKTSYQSAMAVAADGYDMDFLNGYSIDKDGKRVDRGWDYPYYYGDDFQNDPNKGKFAPWNVIANAQAGSIANYGDTDDPSYYWRYKATTEGYSNTGEKDANGNYIYDIFLAGPLNQAYSRNITGSKYDVLFNVGFNFGDTFFVGANLGVTSLNYNYDECYKEAAENPSAFEIDFGDKGKTCFSDYRTRYSYTADGSGVFGKIGFLWRPVDGLRVGAAVQTPTIMEINERWIQDVNLNYTDASFNGSAKTPEGDYSYRLRSPYRLNAGAAFTFAGMALLSADYEMTDYSTMKFMSKDGGWSNDTFSSLNDQIRNCMGVSHMVRVGAEFKPLPEIAVRAGYNFTTTPEYVYEGNSKTKLNDRINAFSVGLGYSSNGSFFADIAARMTMLADEYISPYADYLSDLASPMILNKRDIYNVTATIGWRF
ncbi:MAG: hypothetical protein MR732_08900 [Alistipes sp.]|nr:hypothetical protein [Alistipes sp.]MDY5198392.1 hypothetical protein [Candidatus Cryptobacteroides sp.]